jgi:replicative DNA helicase
MNDSAPIGIKAFERSLPFSDEAEKGVLSCFMHNPMELVPDAMSTMSAEWFYNPASRLLFEEMLLMFQEDKPIEYIALMQRLQDKVDGLSGVPLLEKIGGQGRLAELLTFVPTPTHYGHYKTIMRDKWLLRLVWERATKFRDGVYAFGNSNNVAEFITQFEASAFEVLESAQKGDDTRERPRHISEHLTEWLDEKQERWKNRGKITGITTGLHDLDRQFHGLDDREGEVMVVGARPGQGKTAMMVTLLHHIAVGCGVPTAVFSIEMTGNQLNDRLVLGSMGIDTSKGHSGMFSREEWKRLAGPEFGKISGAPIYLDTSSEINTADIRVRCQTLKRQKGIRVVMIDYLMLVDAINEAAQENERLQIVEVMRMAAWIAKKLKCVVIVLAQLNRETDRNKGKPPVLADLLGSSAIEATAHNIMFLHRPESSRPWHRFDEEDKKEWRASYISRKKAHPECWSDGQKRDSLSGEKYLDMMSREEAEARQDWEEHCVAYIAKNRRGPTREVEMRFRKELTWFCSRTPKLYSNNMDERQATGG